MPSKSMQGRLWIRLIRKNRTMTDLITPCERDDPQEALRQALPQLDLSQPLWLPRHQADWEEYALTRFLPDHFVDGVSFDRMEISFLFPDEKDRPARKRNPLEDV